jgi:hypothetical protein
MNGPKSTLEELKNIYPVESIAPYGIVIIIPAQEFNRDEIADLTEANKIVYSNYQGHSSVFIKLPPKEPKPESPAPTVVFEPPPSPETKPTSTTALPVVETAKKPYQRADTWSKSETDLLKELYKKETVTTPDGIIQELRKHFPDRTDNAIRIKASKLFLKLRNRAPARATTGGDQWKNVWQPNENTLLIELWNREPHLTLTEIAIEFSKKTPFTNQTRTENAVGCRLTQLQKEKKIEPRWHIKKKKGSEPPAKPKKKVDIEGERAGYSRQAEAEDQRGREQTAVKKAIALFNIMMSVHKTIAEIEKTQEYLVYKLEATAIYAALPDFLKTVKIRKEYITAIHGNKDDVTKFSLKMLQLINQILGD